MTNLLKKRKTFNQIIKDIKAVKIQGATTIAKKALYAFNLFPSKQTKEILLSLRPTEPMLLNVLHRMEKQPYDELINHFSEAQDKINKNVLKLVSSNDILFTHCHSTNVIKSLIFAKHHKKNFQVYTTETRPLYQGRRTSKELNRAGIRVTQFVDSAMATFIEKENKKDKFFSTKIFLGADAILEKGIINKVGSKAIAQIAYNNKIPVYIIADSWKYSPKDFPLEERNFHEVWKNIPRNSHIKVRNPAFEFVPKKYIKAVVTDLGILNYKEFLKKVH
jgi:ribose 1,5-bisphosphate isomerase